MLGLGRGHPKMLEQKRNYRPKIAYLINQKNIDTFPFFLFCSTAYSSCHILFRFVLSASPVPLPIGIDWLHLNNNYLCIFERNSLNKQFVDFGAPIPSTVLGAYRSLCSVGSSILLLNDCSKIKRRQSTSFYRFFINEVECVAFVSYENRWEFSHLSNEDKNFKRGEYFSSFTRGQMCINSQKKCVRNLVTFFFSWVRCWHFINI